VELSLGSEGRLITGCGAFDGILDGGFRFGRVALVYGEASTGKTTVALACAVGYLRREPRGKVFYVDADNKLSTDRLVQMSRNETDLLERFIVMRPQSFHGQTELVEELSELLPPQPTPMIVDSITGSYRLEAGDPDRTFVANKELNRQLGFLSESTRTRGTAVLLTGQVHSVLRQEPSPVEMVAQRLLTYWSDTIVRLEPTHMPGVRQATIEKPRTTDGSCRFGIGEEGLREAERPW